jgi:uncharacterized protein (DUF305 family)
MKTAILCVVACLAFASCTRRPVQQDAPVNRAPTEHSTMDHGTMESSPGAANAPYELQFLDTMIVHHGGAIDAAQLVATRAQHKELIELAKAIVVDQQREVAKMKQWRLEWFGDSPPAINMDLPGMRDGMKDMDLSKLDALKENDFDLEFIRQMVPHHEGAVTMAKDVLSHEVHPEVKELAGDIVRSQSDEIEKMKAWQESWQRK